jgi:hypothetical protein
MVIAIVWLALIVLTALVAGLVAGRRPKRFRAAIGFVGLALFVIAILLGCRETVRLEWYLSTARWPAVSGKVISAEVVGKRAFAPRVVYSYQAGDSVYTGVTDLGVPGFGNKYVRLEVAEQTIADYKPDAVVTVHYDPNNPQVSRLRANVPWNVYVRLSTGVFGSLLGVAMLAVFLVGRRTRICDTKKAAAR